MYKKIKSGTYIKLIDILRWYKNSDYFVFLLYIRFYRCER